MNRVGLFLYNLAEPRSEDEDSRRREFILNVLLLGSVAFAIVVISVLLIDVIRMGSEYSGSSPWLYFFVFAGLLTLYFLSRRGLFNLASYALLGIYFILPTQVLYIWGVENPFGLLAYVLMIIMSSVLISTRFAWFSALFISVVVVALHLLQKSLIILPNLYWKDETFGIDDIVTIIFILGVIMIVSWLSNREIERSLYRARRSEADLKKERDLLEIKVEERTEDLKKAQIEKTLHLYRFAELGRITSGLFHDLVNHLTSASLNLEDLKRENEDNEGVMYQTNRALKNIEHIKAITIAGRSQIQKQEIKMEFSPSEEVSRALDILAFKAQKMGVVFDFTSCCKDAKIYGSPVKFFRLVTGFVSNAIDAYEKKEAFDIEIEKEISKKVAVSLEKKDEDIGLVVKDWGCGISKDCLEKIFQPLFTTKDITRGTGMGLSICKEIAEKDFGRNILVKSAEGEGTTFAVDFPLSRRIWL